MSHYSFPEVIDLSVGHLWLQHWRNVSSLSRWHVLPELLGKWYSKEPIEKSESISSNTNIDDNDKNQADETRLVLCYCRKEESGEIDCL